MLIYDLFKDALSISKYALSIGSLTRMYFKGWWGKQAWPCFRW